MVCSNGVEAESLGIDMDAGNNMTQNRHTGIAATVPSGAVNVAESKLNSVFGRWEQEWVRPLVVRMNT